MTTTNEQIIERITEELTSDITTAKEIREQVLTRALSSGEYMSWGQMSRIAEAEAKLRNCERLLSAITSFGKDGLVGSIETWTEQLMGNHLRASSSNHFSNALENEERDIISRLVRTYGRYVNKFN